MLQGCPRQKRRGTFVARRMGLAPGQQPHAQEEEGKSAKRLPQGKTEDEGIPCRGRRKEKCNNGMSIDLRREEEKHTQKKKRGLPQAGGVDPSHLAVVLGFMHVVTNALESMHSLPYKHWTIFEHL